MAKYDRYRLMGHPLCKSLAKKKFHSYSLAIFLFMLSLYFTFLGLFTTIVFRSKQLYDYYNETNISFTEELCRDAIQNFGESAKKDIIDRRLMIAMYVFIGLNSIKNISALIIYIRINPAKTFTFVLEMISIILGAIFIHDADFQVGYVLRCPTQWQAGSFGLLIGYIGVFYYMQFIPVIGLYVLIIRQIVIRFLLFLPVLLVLIAAFAFSFHMLFKNFDSFSYMYIALSKIGNLFEYVLTYP